MEKNDCETTKHFFAAFSPSWKCWTIVKYMEILVGLWSIVVVWRLMFIDKTGKTFQQSNWANNLLFMNTNRVSGWESFTAFLTFTQIILVVCIISMTSRL